MAWCKKLKIRQNIPAGGNLEANGQMEVINRTLLQHMKARLDGTKGSWADELLGILWPYRTTLRLAIGENLYA